MSSAAWSLQTAIHEALTSAPSLTVLLGGPRIWDHVPRGAALPYISIGLSTERDWSTGSDSGSEHVLTLHVWSKAGGRHEVETIAEAAREAA